MTLLTLTGILAGSLHVLAGPDHLAIIGPFSVEARRSAWRVGLHWGLGHAAGLLSVAALAYLLRDLLDFRRLEAVSEPLIGLILIAVGIWGLRHLGPAEAEGGSVASDLHLHTTAALLVGVLHGVAGTGGVLAVIPVLGLSTWLDACLYLLGFGAGTISGMVIFALTLGWVATRSGEAGQRVHRRIFLGASLVALLLGAVWIAIPLTR